jgi:hypothetical protein
MANADSDPKASMTGPAEESPDRVGNLPSGGNAGPVGTALPKVDNLPAGEAPGEDNLLAAVTSVSSDAPSNIDTTLDQLTSATDLFDVPALDLDA